LMRLVYGSESGVAQPGQAAGSSASLGDGDGGGGGGDGDGDDDDDDDDDDFLVKKKGDATAGAAASSLLSSTTDLRALNTIDSSRLPQVLTSARDWYDEAEREAVINRFVTGDWAAKSQAKQAEGEEDGEEDDGSDDDGGFEDLETGAVVGKMSAEGGATPAGPEEARG